MAERTMTLERAMNNAIISTEMEGFTLTAEQRELMKKVLTKELTLKEAIADSERSRDYSKLKDTVKRNVPTFRAPEDLNKNAESAEEMLLTKK